jgi:tetratricopeptide (TPR) repeat protein
VTHRKLVLSVALEHHAERRFDLAAQLYQRLHAEDKTDSEVLFLLGVLCCDIGTYPAAVGFLERALAIAPNFPEAREHLQFALQRRAAAPDLAPS